LLPDPALLAALCRICGATSLCARASEAAVGLDELCLVLVRGADPEPLILWARALRRPGLSSLLERAASSRKAVALTEIGAVVPRAKAVLSQPITPGSAEDLFEQILQVNFVGVLRLLASGVALDVVGPAMFNGDPGCCKWCPLSAAAHSAGRYQNAACLVALLLAARARADVPCPGPCRWTPLMWAAQANNPEVCRMLILAHADPRCKHAGNGSTALDMANKETARAIMEAREQKCQNTLQDEAASASCVRAGRAIGRGRGSGRSPNLNALGYAGRGKPSPKARR